MPPETLCVSHRWSGAECVTTPERGNDKPTVQEFVMAVKIIESCVNCFACEPVCPSKAIFEAKPHFLVDAKKCTECEGDFPVFQCASICPIEGAILNSLGEAINPPGSLTGIPPEKMAEAMAELQSH
jgi:ferredoxin